MRTRYALSLLGLIVIGMASGPGAPLPDDPGWREIGTPAVPLNTMSYLSGWGGRFYAHTHNRDDNWVSYSPDGVQWLEVPPGMSGQAGADGEQTRFASFETGEGELVHAFGLRLYSGGSPREWKRIPENRDWLSVATNVMDDAIIRVGLVQLEGRTDTVAAVLRGDGSWTEVILESSENGFYGRLLKTPNGLLYAGGEAFWTHRGGGDWEVHEVPALLEGVPRGEIKGDGPFMVDFSGAVGSLEAGDLRFISVFARSEDGLEWTDATTDVFTHPGRLSYIPPWFSKDHWTMSDGIVSTDTYVSLDGLDWRLYRPEGHVRVAASAVRETHRVGHHGNRIFVFDQVAPLPAPAVTATDGRGGIHLSWSAINGADYYVAVLANRTLRTDDTGLFIPSGPGESALVSHRIDARVFAVAPGLHPGLSSEPVSATAYRGDLPSPTPPEDVSFTRQLFTNAFILSWRATGGTAIHEVAWSPTMDGARRETIGRFRFSNITLPVGIMPPCSTVYLWVRGSNGFDSSAWAEPLAITTLDGGRPCPPEDFSVTIGEDGEHFRMTWSAVPHASRYQIERRRASGDSNGFERIAEPTMGWAADAESFFDTTYHYRVRARLVQPFLEPVYSEWSQPFVVSRPPSEWESLSLTLLGWESLGDGRFMAEDMGGLHIIHEGSDWIRLDEGWELFIGEVDEHLNLAIHVPHGETGWAMLPIGMWPYLWSVHHGNWIWAAPGGQWIWDFQRARWWRNGTPFE